MFRRLLLLLPHVRHADAVVQTGLSFTRSCDAEVVFFSDCGHRGPGPHDRADVETAGPRPSTDSARQQVERLHDQASRAAEARGVLSRSVIADGPDPVRSILDAASAHRCDAIVAIREGDNAVVRLLNGSVIPGLVSASPVPVLVWPPAPAHDGAGGSAPARMLVLLEGADPALSTCAKAVDLARKVAADLLFVRVAPPSIGPAIDVEGLVSRLEDRWAAEIQTQSLRLLAAAGALAARAGLKSRGMSLPSGTTPKDIARVAVAEDCDLIVIGHRSRSAVMRLLTGSLIPGLITAAARPMLICREPERPPMKCPPRRRLRRQRGTAAAAAARAAPGRNG